MLSSTDVKASATTYQRDATDTFVSQVNFPGSAGLTTKSSYDVRSGLLNSSTDYNGNTTVYTYDSLQRPLTVIPPGGGGGSVTYTPYTSGSPASTTVTTNLHGSTTLSSTTTMDLYGRTQSVSQPDGGYTDIVSYGYDADGRLSSQSNPYHTGETGYGSYSYQYDVLGRLRTVQEPGSSSKINSYLGNQVSTLDEQSKMVTVISDGLGRISQVEEPDASGNLSYITSYSYNQNYNTSTGSYQTVIQQKGGSSDSTQWRTRTFTTDFLGRTTQEVSPEAGTTTYDYGSSKQCSGSPSLICHKTDQRGATETYSYDLLNRLTGITYSGWTPAAPNVAYIYDQTSSGGIAIANGLGARTSMTDGSGSTVWSYDSLGRPTFIQKTINGVTRHAAMTYNNDSTVNTLQDFSGSTFTYAYDGNGRQTGVVDDSGHAFGQNAMYNAAGQLTGLTHQYTTASSVYNRSFSYNSRLQIATIATDLNNSTIQSLAYGYGPTSADNGTITSITNGLASDRTQSFSYDQLNRLTAANDSHWGEQYSYDAWGNLYGISPIPGHSGHNWTATADASNRLSNLQYDSYGAGNVVQDQFGTTYTYDSSGRIVAAGGGSYLYDGDGNRVAKTVGGETTLYWLGLNESDGSGTSFGHVVTLAGIRVWTDSPTGEGHFLFGDHLGSTRLTADATGVVHDDFDYFPFGDTYTNYGANASNEHYLFTGDEKDNESSTSYAVNRNLSGSLGRWTRPDPHSGSYDFSNPQSLNRYSYVLNNPLALTDPLGLDPCDTGGGDKPDSRRQGGVSAMDDDGGCDTDGDGGVSKGGSSSCPVDACVTADPLPPIDIPDPSCSTDSCETIDPLQPITLPIGLCGDGRCLTPLIPTAPSNGQEPPPPCQAKILNATNNQFGTNYTNSNVTNTFNYSTGAGPGQGTLNLNISGSTAGVSTGYYPVHWWTYVIGYGATLHVVSGPGGNGGLDSQQTLPFGPNQGTFHIDSGYPINPIGAAFHWLLNMTKAGGYPKC